jgi:hypothetical protein
LIQILSFGAFLSLATGNPAKFAIVYSLGNILAFAAYILGWYLGLDFYLGLRSSSRIWLTRREEYVQLFMSVLWLEPSFLLLFCIVSCLCFYVLLCRSQLISGIVPRIYLLLGIVSSLAWGEFRRSLDEWFLGIFYILYFSVLLINKNEGWWIHIDYRSQTLMLTVLPINLPNRT